MKIYFVKRAMIIQLQDCWTLVLQEMAGLNLAKGILFFSFQQIRLLAASKSLNSDKGNLPNWNENLTDHLPTPSCLRSF